LVVSVAISVVIVGITGMFTEALARERATAAACGTTLGVNDANSRSANGDAVSVGIEMNRPDARLLGEVVRA